MSGRYNMYAVPHQNFISMDIIYHRNCLDGVFSSFIAYLFAKLLSEEELNQFIQYFHNKHKEDGPNLAQHPVSALPVSNIQKEQRIELTQDFYHKPTDVTVNAYSFFAGQYHSLSFPGAKKVLLIIDTNLATATNIKEACKFHQLVILIDHHTSFKQIQSQLLSLNLKNLHYLFDESKCAAQLTYRFLNTLIPFSIKLTESYLINLQKELCFVNANDTKINETKQSKAFVLGFYYFDIELSHLNPNLYKRIGMLDLQYLMTRGVSKNLYKQHLQEIADESNHARVATILRGKLQNKTCMYLQPRNRTKISDIGIVLAFLSVKYNMENLALLGINNGYEMRLSCRSHKNCKEPRALQLASQFGGGGHLQAAGFKNSPNSFRSNFKISPNEFNLKITGQDVEDILLARSE